MDLVLISVIYCLSGMVQISQSLTCTHFTDHTCTKSLYVTENCVSDQCQCVNGALPFKYGCVKSTKPTVAAVFLSSGSFDEKEQTFWSQETYTGAMMFQCSPKTAGQWKYKWFQNNVELQGTFQTNNEISIHLSSEKESIQCSVNAEGFANDKSDEYIVTVTREDEPLTVKPMVTGIPKLAALNSVLKISCVKVPSKFNWFVFNIDGVEKREFYPETLVNMTAEMFGKTVTCSVKPESETWSITSDPATLPANPATDIPDVLIEGKNEFYNKKSMSLSCVLKESFEPEDGVSIVFEWSGPDKTATDGITDQNYSKQSVVQSDSGKYTCKASYKNNPAKTSPEFQVTVVDLGLVSLSAEPLKPLVGGHMSLTCSPQGASPTTPLYNWNFLPSSYTDNTVQVNEIGVDELGQWMSCDFDVRGGQGDLKYISAPLPVSEIPPPTLDGASKSDDQDKYVMNCNSEYNTPGAQVSWYVDSSVVDGETSNTWTYSQTNSEKESEIHCSLYFFTNYSPNSKKVTIPKKGSIATPVIEVKDSPQWFVDDASYTLLCSPVIHTTASYEWKKNGVKLASTKHFLELQRVDKSVDGSYTCTVRLGILVEESKPFQFVVQDDIGTPVIEFLVDTPLNAVINPFEKEYGNLKITYKNKPVYLRCSSPAHTEEAKYDWKLDSKSLNVPDNVLSVSNHPNGVFSCEINLGGKKGVSWVVAVNDNDDMTSPITDVILNPMYFILGGNYSLRCNSYFAKWEGAVSFRWTKDEKLISMAEEQVYHLNNIQEGDEGDYKCAIIVGTRELKANKSVSVAVTTKGKYCTAHEDCEGYAKGKVLICASLQCRCSMNVIFDGKKCVSHGSRVTYSGLLLVLSVLCLKFLIQF